MHKIFNKFFKYMAIDFTYATEFMLFLRLEKGVALKRVKLPGCMGMEIIF